MVKDRVHENVDVLQIGTAFGKALAVPLSTGAGDHTLAGQAVAFGADLAQGHAGAGSIEHFFVCHGNRSFFLYLYPLYHNEKSNTRCSKYEQFGNSFGIFSHFFAKPLTFNAYYGIQNIIGAIHSKNVKRDLQ
jgi:hypothetical protein